MTHIINHKLLKNPQGTTMSLAKRNIDILLKMLIINLKIYKKNFLSSLKNLLIFLPLFLSNLDLTRELLFQLFLDFYFLL